MNREPTILIVSEDNAQYVAWLGGWLARQPWPVDWQGDVAAALRVAMRSHPRLVLVDVTPPLDLPPRLNLITILRDHRPQCALVATGAGAAEAGDDAIERAVRTSGAHLYLADPDDLRILDALLAGDQRTPVGAPDDARSPPLHRRRAYRVRGRPPWDDSSSLSARSFPSSPSRHQTSNDNDPTEETS
jgi:ActR/RegA family two-component response regulator